MPNVLVIGDKIVDRTHFCDAKRLCPEAPVPVLSRLRSVDTLGGAGLVVSNLESLGEKVTSIYASESLKERYFVDSHLVARVDEDSKAVFDCTEAVTQELKNADAVIISDYCKGAVTFAVARICVNSNLPVFVDTKNSHIEWFRGENVTLFPNAKEYAEHVAGKEHLFGRVVAKLGADGCELWDDHRKGVRVPTRKRQAADVTGAGDCFIAAYVHAYLTGIDPLGCCAVANEAAGASVEHIGTYIVKQNDLKRLQHLFDVAKKVCV